MLHILLSRMVPRRRARLLAAALACALLPAPAAAHTRVESTAPADGDTARSPVREVRLRFSGSVESGLTSISLSRNGEHVASGGTVVPGTDDREYLLALPRSLEPGAYAAQWKTAGADGHVLTGTFRFVVAGPGPASPADSAATDAGIGDGPAESARPPPALAEPAEPASDAARPLAVLVRWGWFGSLLAMIGVVAFRYGVLPGLDRDPATHVVARRAEAAAWFVALGAAALSLATMMLRLWLQAAALGPGAWRGDRLDVLLTGTGWGLAWVLQAIATLAFVLGLFVARAPYGRAAGWMGAAAGAVLLAAVPALSGHAASVTTLNGVAIASDALHVLGAGVWLGTLLAVLAVGIPAALTAPAGGGDAVLAMVRAFSPMALAGAATVGVTGIINTVFQLGAVSDLWTTGYGRALLIKLVLLTGVAALAWYNWKRVLPALGAEGGPQRLRRSARAELAVAALVLLATAVLVALPTP